ncbi:MAG: FISUMP domain-containing protein [Paludibacter sp.]
MKKILFFLIITTLVSCSGLKSSMIGTFTDTRDGKTYRWVKLKDQIWMAQNLNYETQGALESYGAKRKDIGKLYKDHVIQNIAPAGWHIPTDAEWQILEKAAGMTEEEVNRVPFRGSIEADLLEGGCTQLNIPFTGNLSNRSPGGTLWEFVNFWTSTPYKQTYIQRSFRTDDNRIGRVMPNTSRACFVRCIKNDTTTLDLTVEKIFFREKQQK